jgi:ATP cone domain
VSDAIGLPAFVKKRDGRLVPFEPDKICQALFAASESLGHADAFLARELTDGVLHFLAREWAGEVPATTQVAELVAKVVRELGQPKLAQAFSAERQGRRPSAAPIAPQVVSTEARPSTDQTVHFQFSPSDAPDEVARNVLREYSLRAIYSRDIVAAHVEGWLTLTGLEHPLHLAGGAVDVTDADTLRPLGQFGVIDGLEYYGKPLAEMDEALGKIAGTAILNVNCITPPAWAEERAAGPLFGDEPRRAGSAEDNVLNEVLARWLLPRAPARAPRILWHLSERDFQPGTASQIRLHWLARRALEASHLEFVFDRPRRPIVLAEGIDRKHPAVLLTVGLHLPRLLSHASVAGDRERFLVKLGSLTRMAVSAGVQKRNFLRARGENMTREFLLDRARLVVAPLGLESMARALTGSGLCDKTATDFAQQVVSSLCANLRCDGKAANLDACVDGAGESFRGPVDAASQPGLTPWDATASLKSQIAAAGSLHESAAAGTAIALVAPDLSVSPEEVATVLHFAWKQTEVVRLRFARISPQQAQLPL